MHSQSAGRDLEYVHTDDGIVVLVEPSMGLGAGPAVAHLEEREFRPGGDHKVPLCGASIEGEVRRIEAGQLGDEHLCRDCHRRKQDLVAVPDGGAVRPRTRGGVSAASPGVRAPLEDHFLLRENSVELTHVAAIVGGVVILFVGVGLGAVLL